MGLSNTKTVLITGASGFIGSHIVDIFSKHHWNITAVVNKHYPKEFLNKKIHVIQFDLSKGNLPIDNKFDVVVHVAGLASDIGKDKIFKQINFETVKSVSKLGKKFIYISSSDVYGIKDFHGETEDELKFETNPINPYPKYKIESEKWIRENLSSPDFVILRPGAVWGKRDKTLEKRFVDFLKISPFFVFFGKWRGKNRWPLSNVETVAKVAYTVAQTDKFNGEAITLIDSKKTTMKEFYQQLAKKYYPNKHFYNLYLPFGFGCVLGGISTFLSNLFCLKHALFDPSLYAVHHISSNLDWSSKKQEQIIKEYEKLEK